MFGQIPNGSQAKSKDALNTIKSVFLGYMLVNNNIIICLKLIKDHMIRATVYGYFKQILMNPLNSWQNSSPFS